MSDRLPESNEARDWIDWTTAQQALASDPQRSAWVSANAGSGKTHVLTQRVIRLLLKGARPSSILCLTYTKAAASEMSNRVFSRLAEWATLPDATLAERIAKIEGRAPDQMTLIQARQLFARALETPGGLKIQTIHAFCEALLHQFPLEANVAGHFSVLDDRSATALLSDARRSLLTATTSEEDGLLASAFAEVLSLGDEWGLDRLLSEIVANRQAIRDFMRTAARRGGIDDALRDGFGIGTGENEVTIAAGLWPLPGLSGATLTAYIDLANTKGGVTVQAIAAKLAAAVEAEPLARVQLLEEAFFTAAGAPKAEKTLCSAAMLKANPALGEAVLEARDHVVALRDRLRIYWTYRATASALVLAERLDRDYEQLKKVRSQLDFEDLIARTAELLTKSAVGPWIHYKLDQGIDHILVDEAQDTSPVQWSVIRSLRDDFFSGDGARALLRTFFAVGDEKQSIYSFQGARPERFAVEASETRRQVEAGGQQFSAVRLPLSFRSTAAVLSAVDQVFSLADNARGLGAAGDAIVHMSSRTGHPGSVEFWEPIAPPEVSSSEDWTAPFDATPESAPPAILARRIAHRIAAMIGRETIVEDGRARFVEPGDVLILVRKRGAFVTALTRELKRRGDVPVAGADRLRLNGHIAAQDLLALGRFVLLPADDLSLAAVLKSPLFDLSEDDVFTVSAERAEGESVWMRLQALAGEGPEPWQSVRDRLEAFIEMARVAPVYDFYAHVLGRYRGRRAFLARLGAEVNDILDEFLAFALAFETAGLPSLQAFVSGLELETPEVKREQDKARGEVRIMTVHASKGLEAPVVFLADGGSPPFNATHLAKFRMMRSADGRSEIPVWQPGGDLSNSLTEADAARNRQATEEEYRRLLYVAMTRAADRLIICGYRSARQVAGTWHEMIAAALASDGSGRVVETQFNGPEGDWGGFVWQASERIRELEFQPAEATKRLAPVLPQALFKALPPPPDLPRPLSPSGAGIVIEDESPDQRFASPLFDLQGGANIALQKGHLVHRMLQMLPGIDAGEQAAAARRYAERAARSWPEHEREALIASVLAVLAHPQLSAVFGAEGQAEVSIAGRFRLKGAERAVSGRIDRLAVTAETVFLVDYKTNRSVPVTAEQAPLSHRAQLTIYREVLRPLYPDRHFECLLVYTQDARVIPLSEVELARTLAELESM